MKINSKLFSIILILLFSVNLCVAQSLTWYRFDKTFITNHYGDSAIGDITVSGFHPATVHSISCGGEDGELHIGFRLPDISLPNTEMPLTAPPSGTDPNWGLVAELPNATSGNGPSLINQLIGTSVTFHGFFRVWDEGHGSGAAPLSNPHHVFEIHPAWGFDGGTVNFIRKDLVKTITGFKGYGRAKYQPMFLAFLNETWPKAYQSGQQLFVGLARNANFYQMPIKVISKTNIAGGHSVTIDVYSSQTSANPIYRGLTAITVSGTSVDSSLVINQRTVLLGFFSVNLKKALEEASGASSTTNAVSVKDSVEFFVFAKTTGAGVSSCN